MARVQLVIADDDQARFAQQAQREGLSFSVWLRAAARDRLERMRPSRPFLGPEDQAAFFAACDAAEGADATEPDWERHKQAIARSRCDGLPNT